MNVLIINGPNLNLLGKREPAIYGNESFDAYLEKLRADFADDDIEYFQTNHEGEMIDIIQQAEGRRDFILLNAGGYTHTSVAVADAVAACPVPVIEIHISCLPAREPFRHTSLIAPNCSGSIMGFGLDSYRVGMHAGRTVVHGHK